MGAGEGAVGDGGDAQAGFGGAIHHVKSDVMQAAGAATDDADSFEIRRRHLRRDAKESYLSRSCCCLSWKQRMKSTVTATVM